VDGAKLGVVVAVLDVDRLLGEGNVAGDGVLGDRQLQILEGVEAGLDLGNDRLLVLAYRVDRQPVGVEERADVGAHLEHDLVDVVGGVDLVRDRLKLLLERQAGAHIARRGSLMAQDCAHLVSPDCWFLLDLHNSARHPDSQRFFPLFTERPPPLA
jgi:hypothetical protein